MDTYEGIPVVGVSGAVAADMLGIQWAGIGKAVSRGSLRPAGYVQMRDGQMRPFFTVEEVERYRRVSRNEEQSAAQRRHQDKRRRISAAAQRVGDLSRPLDEPAAPVSPTGIEGVSQVSPGASHTNPFGSAAGGGTFPREVAS